MNLWLLLTTASLLNFPQLAAPQDNGIPEVMPFSFSRNAVMGKKTSVTCALSSGRGPFRFSWLHDGKPLDNRGRGTSVKRVTDDISVMTIESVTAGDLGNYTCVVHNGAGTGNHTAALYVEDAPQIQPFSFPPNVRLGMRTSVACMASSGEAPFEFSWKQDGEPVRGGSAKYVRIVSDNIATLTIERVGAGDMGNYTCAVTNAAGSDSYVAELFAEGEEAKASRISGTYAKR
ncbi:junctional adhesion molecule A-like [Dermacentor albipictus]|uniref:junctional adhesion molecule A-like n=1 Tax=Dermacentor albipictus TaxID=60249 RepID=UPI0038FC65F5